MTRVTSKWKFTISYKKNGGRHYRLSCARESTAFWRKSCGTYIVILLPELLPTVQSEEVLQTCCVRMCNFHVYKWENAYSKDLNAWKILMNFYLFIEVKKGGGALVHVYVLEHIVSLNYRITWWIFTKLGRDKVLMTRTFVLTLGPNPPRGGSRAGQK